tara:strand:- start:2517 stop:3431 length:915 start_codon:yes stop_codon:yes gene_type:complete
MEIKYYSELKTKEQFSVLQYLGFRQALNYKTFDLRRELDYRFSGGPGGICALIDNKLVGFVGLMQIPTKTITGNELVGGVWCVVTNPDYWGKGICSALMEKAHEYFVEMGCRFCFLSTSKGLISYNLYKKLGYEEITPFQRFPKVFKFSKTKMEKTNSFSSIDIKKANVLFKEFAKNFTGFVIRSSDFIDFQKWNGRYEDEVSVQCEDGYALASRNSGHLVIEEFISMNDVAATSILKRLESKSQGLLIDPIVSYEGHKKLYQKRKYVFEESQNFVFMVKPLVANAKFFESYGDKFYINSLSVF